MDQENPPGLDLARLRAHLDAERPGLVTGPLRARLIEGGRSNLTYVVGDGENRWVLRRPPLGHVLPTAHDMGREHTVISALGPTPVPVPPTVLLCTDESVLGAPFYVMDYIEGTPYRRRDQLEALGCERTRLIAEAMIDTLSELHAVDYASVGLAGFGRPEGYLERQVRRWGRQLDASRSRDIPGIDTLRERLSARLPTSQEPAIVHGDYRLDNLLIGADDRVAAVLDWEMSTLGDPLTDIALLVAYTEGEALGDEISSVATAPGFPPVRDLITRYTATSGRDISAMAWYLGFAFFKLAVILEGIHFRHSQGKTVGEGFDRIGASVAPLVARGNAVLEED
ncbi:phosphotransferase family protein [Saccharomonospora xinjiangensis]|uniref:Putative aminoglycoside phosphotransferase n=1 Tax=Saccharomonospora xinjiangensis XJ-54 TaxID=882086 RepID=I0UX54_9PSEU|nr:phosphotransferase family protein [Saccharomonospora xinjiangensis]EID52457.1 putative aminoglycoside phosphotransferase [Saccharomonospora xinjiangensis XJ-54]